MSLLIGAFIKGAEEEGGKGSRLEEVKFMRTFRVWNIKQSPKWCWNVSAGSASCCDSTEFMILWSVATEPPGYIQHLLLSPQTHLEPLVRNIQWFHADRFWNIVLNSGLGGMVAALCRQFSNKSEVWTNRLYVYNPVWSGVLREILCPVWRPQTDRSKWCFNTRLDVPVDWTELSSWTGFNAVWSGSWTEVWDTLQVSAVKEFCLSCLWAFWNVVT